MEPIIKVSEIFGPTLQGEGALIGRPTVFVRTGGCDFRCSWCDTLHAVDPEFNDQWINHSPSEILDKINALTQNQPILVTLSGGNPALQPLSDLIELGHQAEHEFAIETQGTLHQPWFANLDYLTLSPKPPSSGMEFNASQLQQCIESAGNKTVISFKFVIADEIDLKWSFDIAATHPDIPVFLQPCNLDPSSNDDNELIHTSLDKIRWLNDKLIEMKWYNVSVLPQFHLLLWGNKKGV